MSLEKNNINQFLKEFYIHEVINLLVGDDMVDKIE